MGEVCRFVIPGAPRGKPVARVTARGTFLPTKAREEMDTHRQIARLAMGGRPPFPGAVELRLGAYMPIPQSWSRAKTARALAGTILPTVKPDGSNIQKLAEDALLPRRFTAAEQREISKQAMEMMRQVVIYDDSQITDWHGWKRYSDKPRLVVEVRVIDGIEPA